MDWYHVTFDAQGLARDVRPPGREAWQDTVAWGDIARVCLEMEGFLGSDSLHIFTRLRPAAYTLPLAAPRVSEVLSELIRRGLYDAELAIQAAASEGLFCHEVPPA